MTDPLSTLKRRHAAYNTHNLDAFLAVHASDIAVYTFPDRLLGSGHDHLTMLFAPRFEEGVVHVDLVSSIDADPFLVVEETVDYRTHTTRYVAVYEIRDGFIQSVRFLRD